FTVTCNLLTYFAAVQLSDLAIDHIEVVQVVQRADNSIPLVAGKKTLARVFVKSKGKPITGVTGTLTADAFPGEQAQLLVDDLYYPGVAPGGVPDRKSRAKSLNFVLRSVRTTKGDIPISLRARAKVKGLRANPDIAPPEGVETVRFGQPVNWNRLFQVRYLSF